MLLLRLLLLLNVFVHVDAFFYHFIVRGHQSLLLKGMTAFLKGAGD